MALHLETFRAGALEAVIVQFPRNHPEINRNQLMQNRIDPCDDRNEKEEQDVRSRFVIVGFVLVVAVALITESVLLIGYVAAAASLLTVVTVLVKRAIRRDSSAPIDSFVPRWVGMEDREAA
jgi:hypothetical protein